ncbi:hypothetical protein N7488_003007 [Penicillium malachiteum]|nr:hypothetical protein N7488_003007 [Penicillium malachiteum]
MTNLLQLAIALLADLGLNKPTHGIDRRKLMFDSLRTPQNALAESKALTNDERASAKFRRIPALKYLNNMDQQLKALLASNECQGDMLLARMIHTQQFAERVAEAMRSDEPEDPTIPHAPVALHLKTLRKEFRAQSISSPVDVENNKLLLIQHYAVEILIHDNGLKNSFWNLPSSTNQRIDVLWNLLQNIKAFFETLFQFPPEEMFRIPYSGWGQSTHVILIFARLSNLQFEGWDPQMARDTYDFAAFIEKLIQLLKNTNEYAASGWLSGQDDFVICRSLEKSNIIQKWWQNTRPGLSPSVLHALSPNFDIFKDSSLGDDFWDELMRDCEPLQF